MSTILFTTQPIHSIKTIRQIDALALAQKQPLMKRAAQAAVDCLKRHNLWQKNLLLIVGSGNNGGDAILMAKIIWQYGIKPTILVAENFNKTYQKDPQFQQTVKFLKKQKIPLKILNLKNLQTAIAQKPTIIDGLIGSGLKDQINKNSQTIIQTINNSQLPVLSLDIPSGLNAEKGIAQPIAIKAQQTITFVSRKLGLITANGADYCGKITFADLQTQQYAEPFITQTQANIIKKAQFSPRQANTHKGNYGHLIIIGGSQGMTGAVKLCSQSALTISGVGLITVIVENPQQQKFPSEIMVHTSSDITRPADAFVLGPGLNLKTQAKKLFSQWINNTQPKVIDADALTLLAQNSHIKLSENTILTPHPGEAARLLNTNTKKIQNNRLEALKSLQKKYQCTIVLKGAGTLIADKKTTSVIDFSNGNCAVAGMGDTLAGIIGGLLAQGYNTIDSAKAGCFLHAKLAKKTVKKTGKGFIPSNITH